jgi:uncharacterized protein (DUF4415 family)
MNSERITRVTLDEAKRMKGRTDYARLDAMTDEDIARAVAEDPDAAPLDIDWDKASLVIPHTAKDIITLRVDHDVLEWLRSTGKGYQTRINKVLRAWYEAASKSDSAAGRIKFKLKASRPKSLASFAEKAAEKVAAKKPSTHRTFAKAAARKTANKRA